MYVSFGGPIFLIAVGAILRYATNITVSGVDMDVVGLILMIAGVAILILSIVIAAVNRKDRKDYAESRSNLPPPRR
jgi:TRAP-type C4-dicarboxylate transport system permease small subunit